MVIPASCPNQGKTSLKHLPDEQENKAEKHNASFWRHIRSIDMHRLRDEENIYCISILENFSRAILASAITRSQDTEAYLSVLHAAIRKFGIPEVLVSDSAAPFFATML